MASEDQLKDYQFIYHDDQNKTREDVERFMKEGFEVFGTAIVMKRKPVDTTKKPKIFQIKPNRKDKENGSES